MIGLGQTEIESFRTLIGVKLGLNLEDTKYEHLEEVLRTRMQETGSIHFLQYLQVLNGGATFRAELRALAKLLTIGETYFFRHRDHLRAFTELALPERLKERSNAHRLSILSAGCATGEEPYTLASLVRDALGDYESWNINLLGIDINSNSLEKAKRAKYSSWSLRDTPENIRQNMFQCEGKEFVLIDSIRKMVSFEERNLVEEDLHFWQPERFDIIFCRNVLMYFSTETIKRVIARMTRSLMPGGYLFLGPAETLRGISQKFHLCHSHETFYYQYRGQENTLVSPNSGSSHAIEKWPEVVLPETLEQDDSWVDIICRASERVAKLIPDPITEFPQKQAPDEGGRPSHHFTNNTDLELAKEFFKQERYEDAMQTLQRFPLELETNPDVCLLRAAVLTNRGNIVGAEKVCERLLQIDELNAGAHYLKALCREHSDDRMSAIEQDRIAVYLDSTFAMPHLHLGLLAKQTGDMRTAFDELNRAVRLLGSEDASRILLFGGGFSREALIKLCRAELQAQEVG